MSASRRRTQRTLLTVLGVLLVLLGVRQLANAARSHDHHRGSHLEHYHHQGDRMERIRHHERFQHHDRDGRQEVREDVEVIVHTSAVSPSDVLFERSFRVQQGDALTLDLTDEAVTVVPARGDEATVTVRGEGRHAQREFERRGFSATYDDGELTVRTDPPQRWRQRAYARAQFTVTVALPVQMDASLDTGSGAIRVDRLAGSLEVDTGSGDVMLGTIRGREIEIDTGSGDVRAEVLSGAVDVDTGSGDIAIDRVSGSFEGDSGSGQILVRDADVSAFDASTGSGDVEAALARIASTEVDSGSGSVTLRLPRAANADVDLSSLGGIDIDGALSYIGETEKNHRRGRLGAGGEMLEVNTASGRIHLAAR